ncbi:MAG: hypothetical protein M9913_17145 [Bryobacteraceae bacterium]|nr:hypothetical protein [Solibacteraceae bacterium]MCO5352594.1 hypothetical protein [Bryobacteraceae bacterium]
MRRSIYLLLVWALPATAQTPVTGTLDIIGRLNATQALSTAPARLVSSLPATCTQGQAVFLTTAPLTEWLHICTGAHTWTRQMQSSVAWSSITGRPATFPPSVHSHLAVDLPATALYSTGTYANPAWLTSLAGSKVSGAVPTAQALAANGTNCPTGQAASGVDAEGNAEGCFVPDGQGGSVGTVTSIGLAAPAQFTVFGSPITSSGTLNLGWANQYANTVLAGPASGAPAAPTFRALTSQDLPGTLLYSTGSYANPAWLTSLAWSKLTSVPSTFTPAAHTHLAADLPANVLYSSGTYANPSWLTSLAWSKLTGTPAITTTNTPNAIVQRDQWGDVYINSMTAQGSIAVTGTVWGSLTGNASTASALAANGANCAAGQVPLGVNASGAAEGCYDPNTYRAQQINFGFGGDPTSVIPNTTFHNVWRAHAHGATVTEVACWTDTGTVSLTIRRSDGTNMHSALTCSTSGASTSSISTPGVAIGQGLGFVTASASSVKNLSVSIKYTRSY